MRLTPVNNPAYLNSNTFNSGDVKTGELAMSRGGGRAFTIYSGNAVLSGILPSVPGAASIGGYDLLIWSGAGRLNSVFPISQMQSGITAVFYDSAVPTSGGPFPASGHKIVGQIPGTYDGGAWSGLATGIPQTFAGEGNLIRPSWPFQSGLCVALKSGVNGFMASLTPENSLAFPNT